LYFNKFLGVLHKKPSITSSSLTTIQCAHKIKLLTSSKQIENWSYVQVGEDKGFVENKKLSDFRPNCFQSQYQLYYNSLNLDVSDMYYFSRLDEQMVIEISKMK
jgi:hypothetical protein